MTSVDHKNWSDSEKGKLYFATTPDVALSYAESSDEVPEKHYNSGIIVYKIKKQHLDKEHLNIDKNVRDNEGDTLEYSKDVPAQHLSIHSEHET